MARKERERYTERSRPHRKESGRGGGGGGSAPESGWRNPIVIVAAIGLVLAIVLAVGFVVGRGAGDESAAAPPTAEVPVTEPTTEAPEAEPTVAAGEPITDTEKAEPEAGALWLPGEGEPFAQPEDLGLDGAESAFFAVIETDKGTIRAELWPEVAPAHVNSFVFLARGGFFDGLSFHRVEPWVVQGGDPTGTGGGGPGYNLPAEFNADDPVNHRYGTLAMARTSEPDSAGSQFYFIKDPAGAEFLDGQYTVFGHVIEGMDVVEAIVQGDTMTSVTIEEKPKSESVVSPDDIRAGDLPDPPGETATE